MEVAKLCEHHPLQNDFLFSFCKDCGSLIYDKVMYCLVFRYQQ